MPYVAIIEIPRGTDRRIHLAYDKSGFVDLGPIREKVPVNDGVMPVHYGYIEGTINREEGDEVDVIVFSKDRRKTGDRVEIEILGMLTREDGDHKVIARDCTEPDAVFEELSVSERKLVIDYMGYNSPIASVDSREAALRYLEQSKQ